MDEALNIIFRILNGERMMKSGLNQDLKTVQYWRNGIMLTAILRRAEAEKLIAEGKAYVINGQAVGSIEDGKKNG